MSPAAVSRRMVKEFDTKMTKARAGRAERDTKMKYPCAGVQHVIPKCQKRVRDVQLVLHMQHVIPK